MSEGTKAVFLSYASQDAEAANKICEALRAGGVEVWFDQSELVGGDAWDQKIRKQIGSCALFVPIVSANTQARAEGYFRLEWKLADRRTDLIGKSKAFLLPVCIDETRDNDADVPDSFLTIQWTKAPGGEVPPAFVARVKKLLSGNAAGVADPGRSRHDDRPGSTPPATGNGPRWLKPVLASGALVIVALAYTLVTRPAASGTASPVVSGLPSPASPTPAAPAVVSEARQLARRAFDPVEHGSPSREQLLAAEALCERALVLDPTDPEIWNIAARLDVRFIQGNFDTSAARRERAISRAAQVISLAPDLFESRLTRAYVLDSVATTDAMRADAESQLLALLKERPDDPTTLALLANLARKAGRFAESGDYYDRSGSPGGAAWSYYFGEDFARAEEATERSLRKGRSPSMITLKALLAEVHREDIAAARAIFAEIPASALLQEGPAYNAVRFAMHARRPDEVISLLGTLPTEYLSSAGFSGPKALLIAKAHETAGRREAARANWQAALAVVEKKLAATPNDPELLLQKAEVLAGLGQTAGAEETLRLATQLAGIPPDQITVRTLPIHVRLGHDDEVLSFLTRTLTARENGWRVLHATARFDPDFDPMRHDPRFGKLLRDTLPEGAKPFDDQKTENGGQMTAGILAVDSKSIAVLAFANLSDDKANEYFSDGISEELLNVLAKVPGLKVTARTSSFHFKGKDTPIPEIARQLGVAYVVEGSVRKQGDKVRITAQLIKAADGFHVWSDTFTRDLKDIFAVQDEIAGLVAKNLSLKLRTAEPSAAINPEAFRLYLEGRQQWSERSGESLAKAEALFRQAIALAPDFARAHAGLADVWAVRGNVKKREGQDATSDYSLAKSSLDRALEIDPDLAEAHATRANIFALEGKTTEAAQAFQRALALNPSYASAHQWYGRLLFDLGNFDAGLAELEIAVRLDPLSPIIASNHAMYLGFARRWAESLAAADRALKIRPNGDQAFAVRILALLGLDRKAEALQALRARNGVPGGDQPDLVAGAFWRAVLLARAGDHEAAMKFAGPLLPSSAGQKPQEETFYLYLALGRLEDAFAYAQRSGLRVGSEGYAYLDPVFDPVRDDPRFVRLLEEAGILEQYRQMWAQYLAWKSRTGQM